MSKEDWAVKDTANSSLVEGGSSLICLANVSDMRRVSSVTSKPHWRSTAPNVVSYCLLQNQLLQNSTFENSVHLKTRSMRLLLLSCSQLQAELQHSVAPPLAQSVQRISLSSLVFEEFHVLEQVIPVHQANFQQTCLQAFVWFRAGRDPEL